MDRTAALDFAEKNTDRSCTDDDQILVWGGDGCDVFVDGVPRSSVKTIRP